ncbi:hypothetical protein DICVIV_03372 [Dictyocaulus viviparus]|uniref:Uncharacterized protein n=1 Tax=Dictyocaulus viviparus TaxID=29172 RepID=A0A0D8Y2P7_DICVI|nr:hypothetical protein DICVIV_03372 [Dictyocaulus viviparus]
MDLPDLVKDRLVELDEENNQLKAEVKRLRDRLATNDEILTELEEENVQLRKCQQLDSLENTKCSVLEQTILDLKKTEKDRESSNMLEQIATLNAALNSAQSEIAEMRRARTPICAEEDVVLPSESVDVAHLQEEMHEALYELEKAKNQITALVLERDDCAERADAAANEAQEMARHLKEMREQLHQMEMELTMSRTNISIANKGNSMFAEFVDERIKLEADLKLLYSKYQIVRKENYQLSNELDEARLLALRRNRREEPVRCRCQQMSAEVVKLRGRVQRVESELANAKKNLIDMALSKNGVDPLLKSFYRSLKIEMESLRQERNDLRDERDKLVDENASLGARVSNAEKMVEYANDEVEYLKLQLSMAKEKEQKQNAEKISSLIDGENGEDGRECLSAISSVKFTPKGHVVETPNALLGQNTQRAKQIEQITPLITYGEDSLLNTVDSTVKKPRIQLKKFRFSDADQNSEEDAIRRDSISASELRRMARKQARKGPSKVLPITEPLMKVTAVLDSSLAKDADGNTSQSVLPKDEVKDDQESDNAHDAEPSAAFSQQISLAVKVPAIAENYQASSSLSYTNDQINEQNKFSAKSGGIVAEINVDSVNLNATLCATKNFNKKVLDDVPEEKENISHENCT